MHPKTNLQIIAEYIKETKIKDRISIEELSIKSNLSINKIKKLKVETMILQSKTSIN